MSTGRDRRGAGELFTIVLAKEDFKFSSAHFTVFGDDHAELLHGHNYRVRVELSGRELDADGLLVDVAAVKRVIRRLCEELDSRTLVPKASPRLVVEKVGGTIDITFGERRYRFPAADCVLLPLPNTSIEELARHLWRRLADEIEVPRAVELSVDVGETAGQRCAYRAHLPARSQMVLQALKEKP